MKLLALSGLVAFVLSSCATSPYPKGGWAYTDVKGPYMAVPSKDGAAKTGESCASSVLGVAGWGDASIGAAAKAGGIEKIVSVDYSDFSVVAGVYTKTCSIVKGN